MKNATYKPKYKYIVYGDHLTRREFTIWAEACAWMKYCIENDHKVTGVRKERT